MKNIILLLALLLSILNISDCQQVNLKICKEFKSDKFERLGTHLHSTGSSHFFYKYTFKKWGYEPVPLKNIIIEKYDDNMNLKFSKTILTFHKNTTHIDIKFLNGSFVWVYYADIKKTRTLYAVEIDLDGNPSKPKKLTNIEKYKFNKYIHSKNASYEAELSQDSSKLAIFVMQDTDHKRKGVEAFFCVIDENIDVLWSRKTMSSSKQVRVDILDWELSNDGSVYFTTKIFNNDQKKESKKSKPAYKYAINHITASSTKLSQYSINLNNTYIRNLKLQSDDKGNLHYGGMYANSNSKIIFGFFSGILDSDCKSIQSSHYEFTSKDIKRLGKKSVDKGRKDKKKGLKPGFEIKNIVFLPNGNIIHVVEEIRTYQSSKGGTYDHAFIIMAIEQDKDGKVFNINLIPKKQILQNGSTQSFTTLVEGNNIHYLFSDNKSNMSKKTKTQDNINSVLLPRSIVLAIASIKNGKSFRKKVKNKNNVNYSIVPELCQQISDNKLFIVMFKSSFKGTKYVIGTLSIKD